MEYEPQFAEKAYIKIEAEFKETGIPKVDQFFTTIKEYLCKSEEIRSSLEEAEKDVLESAGLWLSKYKTFRDMVNILFWSLSAGAKGDISRVCSINEDLPPFIETKTEGMCEETVKLDQLLKTYVVRLAEFESQIHEV